MDGRRRTPRGARGKTGGRDAELDDTDTVLLYNGDDHYDSFVPYEGVELPPLEE